mgnify:CR=1 FL=1|tara:strand:- start:4246 stop:6540 length:2295 start_codon:yes stop_codon:yes gene_type:complete
MKKNKKADKVKELFNLAETWERQQWERINTKGYEFANDSQLSQDEKDNLEEQGMPTFTINRIMPVVEMLNFYATANNPRWQAVGSEGSDSDVAAVFSDLSDYIWNLSSGSTLYANAINDSICKSVGYFLVDVDPNMDNGMGEVTLKQPEPFDVYVDPKSRDMLFRDASYIIIRKMLPRNHLEKLFPEHKRKIKKAHNVETYDVYSDRAMHDSEQSLFTPKDNNNSASARSDGTMDEMVEFFETYEKVQVEYVNVFYRIPPSPEQLKQMQEQIQVMVMEMKQELEVQMMEKQQQMQMAVQSGKMLPQRFELEMKKASDEMEQQLQAFSQEQMSLLQKEASKIENKVVSKKEFDILIKDREFSKNVIEMIPFKGTRIKLCCTAGGQFLYEKVLPDTVKDYPLVPFHFKWTGTPFSMSAVSPLIGKQREINKSHQILVHNASLGSSLRWMYEEGSIDAETWEKYSASPGALLPIRAGSEAPTPVMPAPLSNAFFSIVQEGKTDMEYLAGIYSAMQGDTGSQHETYRGMLAMDEYGTRRIKQWMKHSIEPALKQLGEVIMQFSQSVYSANKRFRIIQPNTLQEGKETEINIPMYNDMGEAIGKSMDYASAKFDVKVVAGSTLPVNRWAYLDEMKEMLKMGIVDDIAVLAETDIRNKEQIAKRKSLYAQMQSQIENMQESIKDKDGAIETLERQLVQAGIKGKVMQAEMEITRNKEQIKSDEKKKYIETEGKQKLLQHVMQNEAQAQKGKMDLELQKFQNNLSKTSDNE